MTLRHRTRLSVPLLAVIAIAAGGCRSTGEPLGLLLRGVFVLRTVNGGPLPANISTPYDQTTFLADTLRFEGRGRATLSRTERYQSSTTPPEVIHMTFDYGVRIDGETIYLTFLCPFNANCTSNGPITGHLADADTFVLGDSQPWVYLRP